MAATLRPRRSNSVKFGLIIPVAAGDKAVLRSSDTISSVVATVPGLTTVIVVDDSGGATRPFHFDGSSSLITRVISAPRNREGNGWKGGLACSLLSVYIDLPADVDWWIKCDDDSLCIRPICVSVLHCRSVATMIGMIGREFSGEPRDLGAIERYMTQIVTRRRLSRGAVAPLNSSLEPGRVYRRTLGDLLSSAGRDFGGFAPHCHGGGYLFNAAAVAALRRLNIGYTAEIWLAGDLGEDVILTCAFAAAGAEIREAREVGIALAITRARMPMSPPELAMAGIWLAHSTKSNPMASEWRVRQLAREERVGEGEAACLG